MARYIDADKKIEELNLGIESIKRLIENRPYDEEAKLILRELEYCRKELERTPTADVVEVVRCEKCKYGDVSIFSRTKDGQEEIACYCNLKKVVTYVDSYCPSGKRR